MNGSIILLLFNQSVVSDDGEVTPPDPEESCENFVCLVDDEHTCVPKSYYHGAWIPAITMCQVRVEKRDRFVRSRLIV